MEKAFEIKTVNGVKILFIAQGFDVLAIDDSGNFYGAYQSIESAIRMIKEDPAPLCKRSLSVRG